ncbi:MAG TPA: alpha/beta hydrolase, partial [Acidimicrobiales bacterium]|nr:alpha/beta hydrolase [Acidimicrobiales bacterium]
MSFTQRTIATNGVELQVAEAGPADGPLVVLCHGFPEVAYSWRHQVPALADAGYHVMAPDQRGYGHSSRPDAITDYDLPHLTGDLLGLLDHAGQDQAVFVGHDWGAIIVWDMALRHPDRVKGVVGMSVP